MVLKMQIDNVMKKSLVILPLAILAFVACGDNESHYTEILYPSNRSRIVLADQTRDSLVFMSTDSWRLSTNATEWCSFNASDASFNNKYQNTWVSFWIPLTFTPNTTGKLRQASIFVDGGESSNGAYYFQVPFLGISRPIRYVTSDLSSDSLYTLNIQASATLDSISFRAYGDWTLSIQDGSWMSLDKTAGSPGEEQVVLTIEPNGLGIDRTDTIVLTSNGVRDSIPVLQRGQKEVE